MVDIFELNSYLSHMVGLDRDGFLHAPCGVYSYDHFYYPVDFRLSRYIWNVANFGVDMMLESLFALSFLSNFFRQHQIKSEDVSLSVNFAAYLK